jgi:pimeloyl-ACP methyl ester carboxylesterase
VLTVFRIQKKYTQIKEGLKPIILQHGLLDCSDTWIINDEDKAPAFILANAGYDIWLSNSRGNKHSRKHVKYNPDKDAAFWEFSFQHMADYDLPAVFKYVNNVTNQKIHYVGHSQGTIQMHIALSKRNAVVESLLDKYFGFGPVAYVSYQNSPIFSIMDKSKLLEWYKLRRQHEFMPGFGWFTTDIGMIFCADFPRICADILAEVMDADPSVDNYNRYDVLVGHDPAGTSVQNMAHWKQMIDSKKFQAYDYGSSKENSNHYGQPYPPVWDLSQIRVKMRLFAGSSDLLADLTDVNFLWDSLDPSVKEFLRVYSAGHCTFMWGNDVKPWMNDLTAMLNDHKQPLNQ